ncbi:MAG: hypothetical protein Q9214_000624 [Letrouitia sp. 1 TL-2023]
MMTKTSETSEQVTTGCTQIILGLKATHLAVVLESQDTADVYWYSGICFKSLRAVIESASRGSRRSGSDFMERFLEAAALSSEAAVDEIALHAMKRCSRVLLTAVEDFELESPSVTDYGLDSMIGVELRNWLFKEFGLDIPFQQLPAPTLTFKALAIIIQGKDEIFEGLINYLG